MVFLSDRTRSWHRSALVISFLVSTFGLMGLGLSPAAADPTGSVLAVVVDRITPISPQPGDTLRISGKLLNSSDSVLTKISARLGISASPIEKRAQIAQQSELELNPEAEPIDYFLNKTKVLLSDALQPGDGANFEVSIPVNDLPLGRDGVYALMVEVLGADGSGNVRRQGGFRTFIPWMGPDSNPIDLVWLWPLIDYPAQEANKVLLNDEVPRSLAPGGRLDSLLTVGADNVDKVSWVADPQLLQVSQDMARGYQVRNGQSLSVGDLSTQSGQWISRLTEALLASQDFDSVKSGKNDRLPLWVTPYADIDAGAVTAAGMGTNVVRSTTMATGVASNVLGQAVSGTLYWAPSGRLNKETGDLLASSGVRTVILRANALPPSQPNTISTGLGVLGTTYNGMNAVLVDPGLSATLSLNQSSQSNAILMRQRFLAETALMSQLIREDAPSRIIVAGPRDIRWNPSPEALNALLSATGSVPWLQSASLSDLLIENSTAIARKRGGYGPKAQKAELPSAYLKRVQRASDELAALTAVLDNPLGITRPYAEAILRAQSSAWRVDPATGEELISSITSSLQDQTDKVYALSQGTITLSGESGLVPVTIANDLDRSVTIGVQLRGDPRARLKSEPLYEITIEPGKKVSVELAATIVGGRALSAGVQLLTPEGQKFGRVAQIDLVSTAYARAAGWVIGAAFVAIVLFVVVGITRRVHKVATNARSDSQKNDPYV
ncbi:MAG TPA: hypothetical protein DDZ31_06115 [Actinobacteria bacterium]|nr:hypothetical protein [Actinomycetota bacterium]